MFGVDGQTQGNTERVVGTYGYMAPEYAIVEIYSVKSDVFSFGVLLLEITTERKNFLGFNCRFPTLLAHGLMLKTETISLPKPERPAFFTGRSANMQDQIAANSCTINGLTISDDLPR
ncbi:hypothetical protein C1H46_035186 [Malus baccata]|uniref:Protein kinase domain-containing protein n=1 Tax=Malus baccata TaxID=106549 RepID=A0A540KYI2_MALBA|nr:hypothetical protein C1H46_035186 [Malus baccata]